VNVLLSVKVQAATIGSNGGRDSAAL
jgi:hypothetical protein